MKKTIAVVAVGVALVGLFAMTGCVRVPLSENPGGLKNRVTVDRSSYELDGAEKLVGNVRMGVGELSLSGSATSSDTLSGRFEYAPVSWKPIVAFETDGAEATFSAEQPENQSVNLGNNVRNIWTMKFPSGVPTDLTMKLGVGESRIDLQNVDVRDLVVLTGVGSTKIDLSGTRTNDIAARIECGVGETEIRVPSGMGVRITGAKDGLGDISTPGFSAEGDELVNDAYSAAGPKLEIQLTRGVGEVRVIQVP